MIRTAIALAMLLTASAHAAVMSVFIWDAPPGGDTAMIATAMKAKAIHEQLGASVFMGMDQLGRLHYGLTFENSAARGAFLDKVGANPEFATLMNEASQQEKAGSLRIVHNATVVVGSAGPSGRAIMVFLYKPEPGRLADVIATMERARGIQQKLGARVSVNVDELGWAHYVLNFDTWEAQGKFADTLAASEDWQTFVAGLSANPMAELKDVYRVTTIGD